LSFTVPESNYTEVGILICQLKVEEGCGQEGKLGGRCQALKLFHIFPGKILLGGTFVVMLFLFAKLADKSPV